ncbi:hypothetical protein LQ757_17430 [Agromyces sp. SYSU K20354]|uniref:hypothetical protein n=1 Tax=Agromyces cavernae TaxID=2898659 RepID=UPI001E589A1E|nr:hypothetical protein [Agromyces cavernae]MCD2444068.1 hypothetical protein [Agromyces cavernae]
MSNAIVRFAHRAAGRIPHPVADRLLPGRRRAIAQGGTTRVERAATRLFIGPVNSAGQGYAWARAAERLPGVAAADFMYRNPGDVFAFPADHAVPTPFFISSAPWQRAQRRAVAKRFTHVIVESGRHLFGSDGRVLDQVEFLRRAGVRVALLWHGSDIRLPSRHAASDPDSPFLHDRYPETDRLEEIAQRNRALIAESGLPVFVSTPDLLEHVPGASWLPVVVDVDGWADAATEPALERRRPVVVHAPSNAGLKGSDLIADTVRRLEAEGIIEYREVRGVAAEQMPAVYGTADIVLDQFALGIYGVAACEALAAGRVVVSHVAEFTRETVRERTELELPIVEARADGLEVVLRDVVAERERYRAVAATGPAFVRAVHDGRRSAQALGAFLGVSV